MNIRNTFFGPSVLLALVGALGAAGSVGASQVGSTQRVNIGAAPVIAGTSELPGGVSRGMGQLLSANGGGIDGRRVSAYLFNSDNVPAGQPGYVEVKHRSVRVQAFSGTQAVLPGCTAVDNRKDGQWKHEDFSTNMGRPQCINAASATIRVYSEEFPP